eukprot:TRINITY_DN2610_c0_g1_i6.p1 TRINITY_DN2610_c0_g1~~TRINITY_DN2610_c0_g1_i6.p1  ORF type:complete len:336 (-),score=102.67 TRINITY_DN2610_c0_g1_i6:149-1156(-)
MCIRDRCYTALDTNQRGGEIFEAMGFVSACVVNFLLHFHQTTLGSISGANAYVENAGLGFGCLLVLTMGLLTIANAAAPHPRIIFHRAPTMKYLLRALYLGNFALAAGLIWKRSELEDLSGFKHLSEDISLWMVVGHLTLGSLFAAAAQLSPCGQRKVLQYSMALPLSVALGCLFLEHDFMKELIVAKQKRVCFHVFNGFLVGLMLFACYYTKRYKMTDQGDTTESSSRANACRFLYVQALYFGGTMLYYGPPEVAGANASPTDWQLHAIIDLMIGMVYIAAAQLDACSQKKLLQYGMTGTLASIALTVKLYDLSPSTLAMQVLSLVVAVHACYM